MIGRIVRLALSKPGVVLGLAVSLVVGGLAAFELLDIEAYPNPVPPLVEVIVQPQGWSAEEVERYVTIPLEVELSGMPGLDHIRSQSLFGLADVKAYFRWGTSYQEARQEVINRLQFVTLPAGLQAQLSPWNAIGEVFRYRVKGKGYSLAELKTAADWILEREFRQVPGVIDVTSFGGETKQYHVDVDPNLLRSYGVTLAQLQQALANANLNTGGQRITEGEQSYTVRGIGVIRSTKDIGDVVVALPKGAPVRVRDVASVVVGAAPRLGQVGLDQEPEVVEGIVLMRYGERTKPTLKGIHRRLDEIRRKKLLPPGMEIEPIYDRGALVALTTRTVMENLLVGILLVSAVLVVFLGNWKAALVTAVNIPLSLLVAFIGMVATGTPANLISLGAVDFGIVVDSTVIMVENVYRHLGSHGSGTMIHRILAAAAEVGRPMAFSTLVIGVAFLPLFTMTGVSGVIFSPMAHTYAFAIGGAFVLAITLTPVVLSRALKAREEDRESRVMQFLHRLYTPVIRAAIRKPGAAVAAALLPVLAGLSLFHFVGAEFMPKLEEGNFWIRATLPTSVSLEESTKYVGRMRAIVRAHPEVAAVVSQLGRPDDGTDVSGFNNIELFAPLRPFGEWRHGLTKEGLTHTLSGELTDAFPGVVFNFSQMIGDNVEEALSGVKGENTVKVVGPDIRVNEGLGDNISDVMEGVRGVHDLGMFRSLGQPSVKVSTDRVRAARYGLNTGDVEAVVQAAVGGQSATQVYEGEKHFDAVIRLQEPYRNSAAAIRRIPLFAPDGTQIALGDVADVIEEDGPAVVFREDGRRYTPVKFSVRGRDLASTIREAQDRIAQKVKLPWDTHLEWAGQINELADAVRRLALIIPITLIAMGFLVHLAVRNTRDVVVVLMSILVACAGGVVSLALSGIHFSVSAAMGFISIFGIAIQGAILVVNYAQQQWAEGFGLAEGARIAAEKRLRPVLMTTIVATLGLLPAALSNDIGAQTQKPLAVVVIGGSLALAIFTPILQPAMLVVFHRRRFPAAAPPAGQAPQASR
ncbi:MAG TPA: CusA/CzcA family heavy metal efflux RND transporter [Anaeromyxobacteraceae bacterium]|nr:CusA/CzcA family heavy metal efflux RND transporter [Anaeromyxobacteraceae bacterium]